MKFDELKGQFTTAKTMLFRTPNDFYTSMHTIKKYIQRVQWSAYAMFNQPQDEPIAEAVRLAAHQDIGGCLAALSELDQEEFQKTANVCRYLIDPVHWPSGSPSEWMRMMPFECVNQPETFIEHLTEQDERQLINYIKHRFIKRLPTQWHLYLTHPIIQPFAILASEKSHQEKREALVATLDTMPRPITAQTWLWAAAILIPDQITYYTFGPDEVLRMRWVAMGRQREYIDANLHCLSALSPEDATEITQFICSRMLDVSNKFALVHQVRALLLQSKKPTVQTDNASFKEGVGILPSFLQLEEAYQYGYH